jgi:hypothetical protein
MESYNPSDINYWGRNMWPIELEEQRNKRTQELNKRVRKLLNDKRFSSLRRKANDLLDWETPEERVNNLYKSPGFWILPPSNLTFFKIKYTQKSKFRGAYKIPYYLLLNEGLIDQLSLNDEIDREKSKLNDRYSIGEIQGQIDTIEKEIEELCFDLYAIVSQYAKYLIWAIDTAANVDDYESDLNNPYGKVNSIEEAEYSYYGAVFGSEFAIYELIDFFVRKKDKELHLEILNKLKPLTKKFILLQITKSDYKRGTNGAWEESKEKVIEILEKIDLLDPITDQKVIEVIKQYSANYNGPGGKGKRLVNRDTGDLVKSNVAKALSDVLRERGISIGEKHIRNKINKRDFELKCRYWN